MLCSLCGASAYDFYSLCVVRLAPEDYHRFHFPTAAQSLSTPVTYPGAYHSVNAVAVSSECDVLSENKRVMSELHGTPFGSENTIARVHRIARLTLIVLFSDVLFIAVGACMVGSITLTSTPSTTTPIARGAEHGYFAFGGSTVLLLLPTGSVQWDSDLLRHTQRGFETLVKMGQRIGVAVQAKRSAVDSKT
jgi:phosphatidylserine decarboxylase